MPPRPLTRLRKLCLALPEAHEVEAWGAPTFRVKNKLFAMYAASNNNHGDGRESVWLKAASGNQELMVRAKPKQYFVPAYVGPNGWVGVYLDRNVDWDELAELLRDGYRLIAPKKLRVALDAPAPPRTRKR
jgi:predicted DNA-binding protein (MmcQ/YjbR family)